MYVEAVGDKFLGLLVSCFLGFLVSWLLGFLFVRCFVFSVSWFLGSLVFGLLVSLLLVSWLFGFLVSCSRSCMCFWCLVSWFQCFKDLQKRISCSWMDIDPISKMCKISIDASSGFVGARLFGNCQTSDFLKL